MLEVRKGDYMKSMLFSDVKSFIKYIQKRSYVLQTITFLLLVGFIIYQVQMNNQIIKRVNHRYFNLTESLKEIHGVNIDTQNGHIIRLIPKQ